MLCSCFDHRMSDFSDRYGGVEEFKGDRLKNYIIETLSDHTKHEEPSGVEKDVFFRNYILVQELLDHAFLSKHYVKYYDVVTYRYSEAELEEVKPVLANMIVDKFDVKEKGVVFHLLNSIRSWRNSLALVNLEVLLLYCYEIQERNLD